MLKSTAPVKIPVFALNKFSPSWEQDECEREQSYRPLLLGQGCAFGLMIGKRMVLGGGVREPVEKQWVMLLWLGAHGILEGAELLLPCREIPPLCPGSRGPGGVIATLLASLQASGQRTKGIPPELGQLAILVLVQTV